MGGSPACSRVSVARSTATPARCTSFSLAKARSRCRAIACASCCPRAKRASLPSTPRRSECRLPDDAARQRLLALLGDLPPRDRIPHGQRVDSAARGDVIVERWALELNGQERVPALLVMPANPRAVVLYCHAHGNRFDVGKDELVTGRPALASPPYAEALANIDVGALAIDHWGFGERASTSERLLNKRFLWDGRTLWGMRIA